MGDDTFEFDDTNLETGTFMAVIARCQLGVMFNSTVLGSLPSPSLGLLDDHVQHITNG